MFRLREPTHTCPGEKCSVIISCAPISLVAEIFVSHISQYVRKVYICPIRGDGGGQILVSLGQMPAVV